MFLLSEASLHRMTMGEVKTSRLSPGRSMSESACPISAATCLSGDHEQSHRTHGDGPILDSMQCLQEQPWP